MLSLFQVKQVMLPTHIFALKLESMIYTVIHIETFLTPTLRATGPRTTIRSVWSEGKESLRTLRIAEGAEKSSRFEARENLGRRSFDFTGPRDQGQSYLLLGQHRVAWHPRRQKQG